MSEINENTASYRSVPAIGRRSARRTPDSRITERTSHQTRALVLRTCVAVVWALLVGSLMAAGAYLLNIHESQIPAIAVLGGAGAAIFVLFFA